MKTVAEINIAIQEIVDDINNQIDPIQNEVLKLQEQIKAFNAEAASRKQPLLEELAEAEKIAAEESAKTAKMEAVEEILNSALGFCLECYKDDVKRIEAIKKFGSEIISQNLSLIQSLAWDKNGRKSCCWCGSSWSTEQKVILMLTISAKVGVSMEYNREFALLMYNGGGNYHENGIYYPGCLGQEKLIIACCLVKNDPGILAVLRENMKKQK